MTPKGQRVAVSGSVSVPKGKPPKGGWPVISYAHGTTGTADVCAPSRNHKGAPASAYISYVDPDLNAWLKAGYAVLRTDYQGLGTPGPHGFLIGKSEGRSVLDIVRAARALNPRIGKRFLISGHSQGGHAALFAAGEAKSYVPDLKLRGTVAYAPASHLREQAETLHVLTSPSPLTGLATLILEGATTQSTPAVPIRPGKLLSDRVLGYYPLVKQLCLPQLNTPNRLAGIPPAQIIRSGADTTGAVQPALEAEPGGADEAAGAGRPGRGGQHRVHVPDHPARLRAPRPRGPHHLQDLPRRGPRRRGQRGGARRARLLPLEAAAEALI